MIVTDVEYEYAQRLWRECGCKNLKDYLLLYLQLDVYLLADVFETFRQTALQEDGLEPLNFFSIPGLAWCSALKSLPRPLELLQDSLMYEFFENGARGGMTFVNKHCVQADSSTELLYIDVNNLYGWALSQPLPTSGFTWIHDKTELESLVAGLSSTTSSSTKGHVFEVDITVPPEWHDKLSQLPPAPISKPPPNSKVPKLLLTLESKQNYIIHHRLLQFYIQHMGVEVTAVHRAVEFDEDFVFKQYIDGNTAKRVSSVTKFAKDYYKLKNNILYGKSIENLRNRFKLRLCNTPKKYVTHVSKASFRRSVIIDTDLIAAHMDQDSVCLNRPIFVGQAVLDLSKLRMYQLQYQELEAYRVEFPDSRIDIVAGDTDSFFLECHNLNLSTELLPAMVRDGLLDT